MPNKSKVIKSLKIPDEYFFHFLRGHLDGDGNIWRYMDKIFPNSERLYLRFASASLPHLEWLQKRISTLADVNGYIEKRSDASYLIFAKTNSLKLLPKIYPEKNVPCLHRKYNQIKSFL